jgi:hypothetical protein
LGTSLLWRSQLVIALCVLLGRWHQLQLQGFRPGCTLVVLLGF